MTKKDYELVAEAVRQTGLQFVDDEDEVSYTEVLEEIATRLANSFRSENERFDREKFMTACGI